VGVPLRTCRLSFVLIAFVFWAGAASYPTPLFAKQSPDRAVEEHNVREAVFRYRMIGWKSKGPFFLSIDGKDPIDSFMARFASSKMTVKKESISRKNHSQAGFVTVRRMRPGYLFQLARYAGFLLTE
jgi:hypothetical protein